MKKTKAATATALLPSPDTMPASSAEYDQMAKNFIAAVRNLPAGCVVQKIDVYYDRPHLQK